jgi:hypothetical protein
LAGYQKVGDFFIKVMDHMLWKTLGLIVIITCAVNVGAGTEDSWVEDGTHAHTHQGREAISMIITHVSARACARRYAEQRAYRRDRPVYPVLLHRRAHHGVLDAEEPTRPFHQAICPDHTHHTRTHTHRPLASAELGFAWLGSDAWNVFDFFVVFMCYMPFAGGSVAVLRLLRLLRVLKLLKRIKQLQVVYSPCTTIVPTVRARARWGSALLYVCV